MIVVFVLCIRIWHVTLHQALRQIPQREGSLLQDSSIRLLQSEKRVCIEKICFKRLKILFRCVYWELNLNRHCRKEDGTLRTMNAEKLLKTLPVLQSQLDALLEFDCTANDLTNGVINMAFMLLFRDLIRLFACYNDGIINLLGNAIQYSVFLSYNKLYYIQLVK